MIVTQIPIIYCRNLVGKDTYFCYQMNKNRQINPIKRHIAIWQ
jgi:hypothetical protein